MTQPLKVNFSSEEAGSAPREVPPSGEYTVNIVSGEIKEVSPGNKNVGKPFWQLRFVIQEGQYDGNSLLSSVMLFDGALYSFAQLMKALDYDVNSGDFEVPELDDIIGRTLKVKGLKMPPKTLPNGKELNERFEIRGYKKASTPSKSDGDNSLLP